VISVRVVFTRKTSLIEHEALCLPNGDLKPEFQDEVRCIRLKDDVLKRHRRKSNPRTAWLEPKDKDGKPLPEELYVEILARVLLWHNNMSIGIGLEVCDPCKIPYTRKLLTASNENQEDVLTLVQHSSVSMKTL
jgi:hypothetical protein